MTSRVASNIDDPDLKDRHKELLTNIWLRGSSTSYSPPMGVASSASSSPREPHQTSAEVLLKMEGKSYDSDDNMFDPFSRILSTFCLSLAYLRIATYLANLRLIYTYHANRMDISIFWGIIENVWSPMFQFFGDFS